MLLARGTELLYVGAMFHDLGLVPAYSSASDRFEVDGANAARDFLQGHNLSEQEIEQVWTSIALHTTPDIPKYMHPVVALLTAGVEMDVLGIDYSNFQEEDRAAISPYSAFQGRYFAGLFRWDKAQAGNDFGNVKADVLADKDPTFRRGNFCSVIRNSPWQG